MAALPSVSLVFWETDFPVSVTRRPVRHQVTICINRPDQRQEILHASGIDHQGNPRR